MNGGCAHRRVALYKVAGDFGGLVRRVVKYLYFEFFAGIIQLADRFQQAVHHDIAR